MNDFDVIDFVLFPLRAALAMPLVALYLWFLLMTSNKEESE